MNLPISFRYYDPLFAIIKTMISQETLDQLDLKNELLNIFDNDKKFIN